MQLRVVKFPTGAETSIVASIMSAVIWPLAIKLVAVRLVTCTVGSIEAVPYPLVGPLLNMSVYYTRAEKRSAAFTAFRKPIYLRST